MAAAQRLLSKQLLSVGRCSLCRQLHTAIDQIPLTRAFANAQLSQYLQDPLDRANVGARSRTLARASFEDRKTGGPGLRNNRYQDRYQDGASVSFDEESGTSGGTRGRDYDGEGASKSFRGWGSFSKPNTWGTKNKKVWKSKQATSFSEDDPETPNELYPTRESVRKGRPSVFSDEHSSSAPQSYREGRDRFSKSKNSVERRAGDVVGGSQLRKFDSGESDYRQNGSNGLEGSARRSGRAVEGDGDTETGRKTFGASVRPSRAKTVATDGEDEVTRKVFGVFGAKPKGGDRFRNESSAKVVRHLASSDGEESGSDSEDEVQRNVFGVSNRVANSEIELDGSYSERKESLDGTSGRSVRNPDGGPRKKDPIKKAYKRPGSIHTEEDQQPWVRGQPRGENPPQVYSGLRNPVMETEGQVYSGLRKQVTETEGSGEEEPLEPSAARDLQWGQEIDFKVYQFTPLGMRVIIRGGYEGLVYSEQMDVYGRERIEVGDVMKGYVGKVRDDNKVDVSLRPFGLAQYRAGKAYLEEQLIIYGGFIPLTSKSSPEEIAAKLQLTKSGFKKAVGGLMKIGRALETEEGIVLVDEGGEIATDRR